MVLDGIPPASVHDSGRIHFGPDDRLYVATGDAGQPDLAQDPDSLNGKCLDPESERVPRRRPGEADVLTLGHRNPQGFDWEPGSAAADRDGARQHGQRRGQRDHRGRNYGWPEVSARTPTTETSWRRCRSTWSHRPLRRDVRQPSRLRVDGGLPHRRAGEQARRLRFDGTEVVENEPLFEGEPGRVRTVVEVLTGRSTRSPATWTVAALGGRRPSDPDRSTGGLSLASNGSTGLLGPRLLH